MTTSIERIIALFYHDGDEPLVILPPQKVDENTYQLLIKEFDFLIDHELKINTGKAPKNSYDSEQYEDCINEYTKIHRGDPIYGLRPLINIEEIDEFLFDNEKFINIVNQYNLLDYLQDHPDFLIKMHDITGFFTDPHCLNDCWTLGLFDIPPTIKSLL